MTNKLVVIMNSLKVPQIKKILLHKMKFLVPNYSCLQNPWLGGYRLQIPVLSLSSTEFVEPPPPKKNSWVRHCILHTYLPMKMEQSVPKRLHIKFRRRGITQMNENYLYSIAFQRSIAAFLSFCISRLVFDSSSLKCQSLLFLHLKAWGWL
jgi:hypothetical protein